MSDVEVVTFLSKSNPKYKVGLNISRIRLRWAKKLLKPASVGGSIKRAEDSLIGYEGLLYVGGSTP